MTETVQPSVVEFSTSAMLETWTCSECPTRSEVVILNVLRGKDDYGEPSNRIAIWGNPDYKPFCPHCGTKEGMSR